jgi:hypothetical protein
MNIWILYYSNLFFKLFSFFVQKIFLKYNLKLLQTDIPIDTIHQYIPESLKQFTPYATITEKIISSVFYRELE